MKYFSYFIVFFLIICCRPDESFIYNNDLRSKISSQLVVQKELASHRSEALFHVLDSGATSQEKELLEFLYAFMPLSDLADYDGEFFLDQVRYALLARETFDWGTTVPNDIFLHFVLPYRVNNENPDSARQVFFKELKPRIQNLSMHDAALEVNHWCHEKVSYHPSDIRTSAPLSTVKNARGRCGEESTFTVTAMRAVGIPARQIYTPRWAHSDDNHAWVEVWIDGKWFFLGACEPEPELNMGWFAGPATRAMLLHTKVYGSYQTEDDVVTANDRYTEINVLPQYAPSKRVFVRVLDKDSNPVQNASVQFQLYNYAEFYPIAKSRTDDKGLCSLLTGFGDLVGWASKDGLIASKLLRVPGTDTLDLVLGQNLKSGTEENYLLIPPSMGKTVNVSDTVQQQNNIRLQKEDSIRFAYEKTFIDSVRAVELAHELSIDPRKTWNILSKSRGNWQEIVHFLKDAPTGMKALALELLGSVSEKDLHDTDEEIFLSHLINSDSPVCKNREIFIRYVLNPHISNELLSDYKGYAQSYFGDEFIKKSRKDINTLVKWINDSIILSDANTSRAPIKPKGILELRCADKHSRDIFFVAVCRSFGIPSRLEASRNMPQVYFHGRWMDASFEATKVENKPKGTITLDYKGGLTALKPEYYIHFTLARFDGQSYRSLDYEFSDIFNSFPTKVQADTGKYSLVTGKRLEDGSVLARIKYFDVSENENVAQVIDFNKETRKNILLGKIDLGKEISPIGETGEKPAITLDQLTNGEGIVLIWIDPDKEPTKHLMNDLMKLGNNFDAWKGSFVFLVPISKYSNELNIRHYKNLPANTFFVVDRNDLFSTVELEGGPEPLRDFPKVCIVNVNGGVTYISSGYKIGNGEQILNAVNTHCTYK
jgi:transglutaminase-like putative cysteine protease